MLLFQTIRLLSFCQQNNENINWLGLNVGLYEIICLFSSKNWEIRFISFADFRTEQPSVFELHLRQFLSKSITKCEGNCGKKIDQEDTI